MEAAGAANTAAEADGIQQLRQRFLDATEPDSAGMILDDACFLRYLRARNGNVTQAAKMLSVTLQWRREFDVKKIFKEDMDVVARENATAKIYMSGFDLKGRPIMVMRPRCENTKDHDGNIKHLVYQMERARAILQKETAGFGKMCLIIDCTGYSLRYAPSLKTSTTTLHVLQNYYPETLGVAYFIAPPFIFKAFWNVIYPLVDVATRDKFVLVRGDPHKSAAQTILATNFKLEELEKPLGGTYVTEFDSQLYLAAPMDQDFRSALAAAAGH